MQSDIEAVWHCDITKNPYGTDTVTIGHSCECQGCRAADEIIRLRKKLDEARANAQVRDYRSFIAGWMRYDTSRGVDIERANYEFEQWYGIQVSELLTKSREVSSGYEGDEKAENP